MCARILRKCKAIAAIGWIGAHPAAHPCDDQVMRYALAMVALMSGCGAAEVTGMPEHAVLLAREAWADKGLPPCEGEPDPVVVITDEGCPDADAEACFTYESGGTVPTIYVARYVTKGTDYIFAHELKHWLAMCSGYDGKGDPEHDDARIWPELF